MVRRRWVYSQRRSVLLIWMKVGHWPIAFALGAGRVVFDIFSLAYQFSFLYPSLWETVRYSLKYCFKGPLSPKQITSSSCARRTLGSDWSRGEVEMPTVSSAKHMSGEAHPIRFAAPFLPNSKIYSMFLSSSVTEPGDESPNFGTTATRTRWTH